MNEWKFGNLQKKYTQKLTRCKTFNSESDALFFLNSKSDAVYFLKFKIRRIVFL